MNISQIPFIYFFRLFFLSFAIVGTMQTGEIIPFAKPFDKATRDDSGVLKYSNDDIIIKLYDHFTTNDCLRFASCCKLTYNGLVKKLKTDPFYKTIPFLPNSFNNQAYRECITDDRDQADTLALHLDKNSWIFNKATGHFFVLAYSLCNPHQRYYSENLPITGDTQVTKYLDTILGGKYDTEKKSITFLSKSNFHGSGYYGPKEDKICYSVNKDHSKMILNCWIACPRAWGDDVGAGTEIKVLFYLDCNTTNPGQIFRYCPSILRQLETTHIAFAETESNPGQIKLWGKDRTTKKNILTIWNGFGTENISLQAHGITIDSDTKLAGVVTDNVTTSAMAYEIINNFNIIADILEFENPPQEIFPVKISESTTVGTLMDQYEKGIVKTEGMNQFIEFFNDKEKNKTPDRDTFSIYGNNTITPKQIFFMVIGLGGIGYLMWLLYKNDKIPFLQKT